MSTGLLDPVSTASRRPRTSLQQLGMLVAGVGLIGWALVDARFRNAEGFPLPGIIVPMAAGLAALLMAAFVSGPLRRFSGWFGLTLVGQAAALQLVAAGPVVRYQHLQSPGQAAASGQIVPLLIVGLQFVLVLAGLARAGWSPVRSLRSVLAPWQLVILAMWFVLTSAVVSRQPTLYVQELLFATFIQTISLANIVLAARALPATIMARLSAGFDRWLGPREESLRPGLDRFAVLAACFVLLLTAALSILVYERHPHVPDEVVYLYHARYFAHGLLAMPAPPVPPGFELDLMQYEPGRWFSPVPPGWPAALAVGARLSLAWLVNPVLAGLGVLMTALLLNEIYERRTTRLTLLLLCASPWYLFLGMSFMTHTFTLVCAMAAAAAVARLRRTGRMHWGALAGLFIAAVGLIRPLEGLAVAVLLGLWSIGGRRLRVPLAKPAVLTLATMLAASIVLPYNQKLTGVATKFPINAYLDRTYGPGVNDLGFGPNRGLGWTGLDPFPGHGPLDVLINANLNLGATNTELLGWATGSLLLIGLLIISGKMKRSDHLMLITVLLVAGIHSLYWFSGGPDFGARYWYLILVPCLVLTVRAIERIGSWTAAFMGGGDSREGARPIAAALLLSLSALLVFLPWRSFDKYHHYRSMRPDIRRLAGQYEFGKSLVLVQGSRHPDYASAAAYNPIDLHANAPVFAWDRDESVRLELLRAYPDRDIWVVEGPTLTGAGYRLVAGPIKPGSPLPEIRDSAARR